jgi:hypothetical protein
MYTAGRQGTLVFPSGVCRMTGSVSKNFSQGGSEQGMVILKGTGDSKVRFMGTGFNRIEIQGLHNLICEGMTFIGDLSGDGTVKEAASSHLLLQADIVTVRDCLFAGLGVSGTTGQVVLMRGNNINVMENTQFRGVGGFLGPVVKADQAFFNRFSRLVFIDYGAVYPSSYSKGGGTSRHWIKVDNVSGQKADRGSVLVEDCFFDEGAQTAAVQINNVRWAEIARSGNNISGFGTGPAFENVKQVRIRDSFFGYTAEPDIVGLKLTNVGECDIDGLRFFMGGDADNGADRIEVSGSAGKLIIRNLTRGNFTELTAPTIVNTAGSEIVRDGVRYAVNGAVQVGD